MASSLIETKETEIQPEAVHKFGPVLILGAGNIGGAIERLNSYNPSVISLPHHEGDREIFNIRDLNQVRKLVLESPATTIINMVAYTKIDKAEGQPGKNGLPYQLNVIGAENVAKACLEAGKHHVLISTDSVFSDPANRQPHDLEDERCLDQSKNGVYGSTKAEGEMVVEGVGGKNAFVRIAFPDFYRKAISYIQAGWNLFDGPFFVPTNMEELNHALICIENGKLTGKFHVVSSGVSTPYEYGLMIQRYNLELKDYKIKAGSFREHLSKKGVAPRPIYAALDWHETESKLGMRFMTPEEQILFEIDKKN